MVTTSSEEAIHAGSGLSGSLTETMVRVGLTRPGTNPIWMPSSSERGSPRGYAVPSTHRRHASQPGRPVDQVEGPDPVVGTPPSPVGDAIGQLGEGFGDRLGYGHGHRTRCSRSNGSGFAGGRPIEKAGPGGRAPNEWSRTGPDARLATNLEGLTTVYDIRSEAVPLEGSLGAGRGTETTQAPSTRRQPRTALPPRRRRRGRAARARAQAPPPRRRSAPHRTRSHFRFTGGLPAVESLYSADLVARINAERAARSTPSVPIPRSRSTPASQAEAQSWSSAHRRRRTSSRIRRSPRAPVRAARHPRPARSARSRPTRATPATASGRVTAPTGWTPTTWRRAATAQNELGAAYTSVGVGVTCSGNQAWTVELFGYSYGSLPSASARQYAQNSRGRPGPGDPGRRGRRRPATRSTAPARPTGRTARSPPTGGQYPYPFAVPPVPGEPNGASPTTVVGMAATTDGQRLLDGDRGRLGRPPTATPSTTARWPAQPSNAPITHIVATSDGKGYWLVGGRRRHLRLRRRRLLRFDGRQAAQRAGRRHRPDPRRQGLLAGRRPTAVSSPSVTPPSRARWAASPSTNRSSGMAADPAHRRLLAGRVRRRDLLLRRSVLRLDRQPACSTSRSNGMAATTDGKRLLVRRLRRRDLRLRRRRLPRERGRPAARRPDRRDGRRPRDRRLLAGGRRRRRLRLRRRRSSGRAETGSADLPRRSTRRRPVQPDQMIDCSSE